MPKSEKERRDKSRAGYKKQGMDRMEVIVHAEDKHIVRELEKELNDARGLRQRSKKSVSFKG